MKITLNSLVRPRIFWPTVIILLITCVSFYIIKEKEKALRVNTQKRLAKTVEEKEIVENRLMEAIEAKNEAEVGLAAEKEKSLALEKEVKDREDQLRNALDKLEKEITTRRQVEAQLMIVMKGKNILETKIKNFIEGSKPIELEEIVIRPATEQSIGKVIMVNKEYAFVVVNLGSRDNLKVGDILSVYRNDEFIGKIQIERAEERMSAAAILPEWKDAELKEDDMVKKI